MIEVVGSKHVGICSTRVCAVEKQKAHLQVQAGSIEKI